MKQFSINTIYLTIIDTLLAIGDSLAVLGQTLIIAFGVVIALVALLIVEHHGAMQGIEWFEPDVNRASFGAFALVILNVALEFQVVNIHSRLKHRKDFYQPSLRFTVANMGYWLGIGRTWKARKLSPAQQIIRFQAYLTTAILVLTIAGRMKSAINGTSGEWYNALGSIVTQSSLRQIAEWLGGLVFSYGAVRGAQFLSSYVANQVIDIKRRMVAKRQQVKRQVERTDKRPVSALSAADGQADGQNHATGQGYSKRTDAKEVVRKHLRENPTDNELAVRELAVRLGVGKTTVSDVKRELEGMVQSSNGHTANGHGER